MIRIAAERHIDASPRDVIAAVSAWVSAQQRRTDAWNGGHFERDGSTFRYLAPHPEDPNRTAVTALVTVSASGRGSLVRAEGTADGDVLRRDGARIPDIALRFAMRRYTQKWLKELGNGLERPGRAVA